MRCKVRETGLQRGFNGDPFDCGRWIVAIATKEREKSSTMHRVYWPISRCTVATPAVALGCSDE